MNNSIRLKRKLNRKKKQEIETDAPVLFYLHLLAFS